jgi:hypothetical protein
VALINVQKVHVEADVDVAAVASLKADQSLTQ